MNQASAEITNSEARVRKHIDDGFAEVGESIGTLSKQADDQAASNLRLDEHDQRLGHLERAAA